MADKMLIDASHAEETRVVVVRGNRIEEFDFESQHKKQIRGNIYLAKVTRVEPSLQAAFVDYGGNRHGFLAFAEIHPDYYQIPLADRQALLRAEAEEHRRDDDFEPAGPAPPRPARNGRCLPATIQEDAPQPVIEAAGEASRRSLAAPKTVAEAAEAAAEREAEEAAQAPPTARQEGRLPRKPPSRGGIVRADDEGGSTPPATWPPWSHIDFVSEDAAPPRAMTTTTMMISHEEKEVIESVGAEDAMEEVPDRSPAQAAQAVPHPGSHQAPPDPARSGRQGRARQQGRGADDLSLARRPLLGADAEHGARRRHFPQDHQPAGPQAPEGDRPDLEVPQGMGVILRTAGANRTKAEVKRDFEYLMRLWENVRTLTLASTAPCLVYEEGSLIKRSIRDLYNKDISEIIVAGEEGYVKPRTS